MNTHGDRRDFPPARLCLTPRDRAVLLDLLRFGALTAEHVRRWHFPEASSGTTANRLRALRRAGYVRTVPLGLHAHGAVLATPRGAAAAGTDLLAVRQREHGISVWLRHALAVADLAALLLSRPWTGGAAAWQTERELARAGGLAYRPDGLLLLTSPDGAVRRMAVEVELTPKQPTRYGPKLRWYASGLATGTLHRVRWYCGDPTTQRVVQRVAAGYPGVEVVPLPK